VIPTVKQWRAWSLPSKLTAVGALAGALGIVATTFLFLIDHSSEERTATRLRELTLSEIDKSIDTLSSRMASIPETEQDIATLIELLEYRAERIRRMVPETDQGARFLDEFENLHEVIVESLAAGQILGAHVMTTDMHQLLVRYRVVLGMEEEFQYLPSLYSRRPEDDR
jgi:hypothetical protein